LTEIAFLFYEDMTALDAVGPYEVLARLPGADCTGSLLLGAAGVLRGKRATSHWILRDMLREFGAEPVAERVVIEGDVITAAGVSAGIDMALTLAAIEAGEDEARALQLVIEYDPDPPFDSGSLEKADADTQRRATEHMVSGGGKLEVTR
jgi:cyclohexyl-isocyanide hydratase